MSNTNYKTNNPVTSTTVDLVTLFNYGNSGITTGYSDPLGRDLGSVFAPLTTTTLPFDTNYIVNNGTYTNKDLTDLFNGITPRSQVYTILNPNAYIQNRYSQTAEYSALIFEYTGSAMAWNGSAPTPGSCELRFDKAVQLNYLIVGGGGGGGQGNFGNSAGAGGSGAGTIYNNGTTLSIPANTSLLIQVAYNGGGNNNSSPSLAQCTGAPGGVSSILTSYNNLSLVANGGGGGGGYGTVTSNTPAGNSSYFTSVSGPFSNLGGGGGSGGGAASAGSGGPRTPGAPGYYLNNQGTQQNLGSTGTAGTTTQPGNGGNGYYPGITTGIDVPFSFNTVIYQETTSRTVCCGNGGGGGRNGNGGYNGGQAGKTQGGSGGGSSTQSGVDAANGYNADTRFYYGNGGGGAGQQVSSGTNTFRGGNGAEGVVMLWWRLV